MLDILQRRFEQHMQRHANVEWATVAQKLTVPILQVIEQMEQTGGEPDVVVLDGKLVYVDCSKESPIGRRSICYDDNARLARKKNAPTSSAEQMARSIGITILNEDQYRALQQLGEFDMKTSSWIATPADIRNLGGALFGDRRYNTVFVYHNGADSYYSARGFRGMIEL